MDNEYLIWLAGFFDGEGSVGLWSRGKNVPKSVSLNVGQKNEAVIREIHNHYPEGLVLKGSGSREEFFTFCIRGYSTCERFLRDIEPYLRVKREKVQSILQVIEEKKTIRGQWGMYRDNKSMFIKGHTSYERV